MQPASGERLHFGRHLEVFAQNGFEPFRVADLVRQAAGEEKFRGVGNRIALLQRLHADAEERADEDGIPLILGVGPAPLVRAGA